MDEKTGKRSQLRDAEETESSTQRATLGGTPDQRQDHPWENEWNPQKVWS